MYVRIIILNYNSAKLTIDLIKMLKNQLYKDFEIVVVDNASCLNDQQYLLRHIPEGIFLVISEYNKGYFGGNNLGLHYQSGTKISFYLILNSDIIIEDNHLLSKLIEGFKTRNEKTILAQSPLVDTISSSKNIECQVQVRKILSPIKSYLISFSIFKILFKKIFKEYIYFSEMPFDKKLTFCDSINGSAFMITHVLLEKIKQFDEKIFLYHEEMILGKQIQNLGGICLLNGFAKIKHIQGISTNSNVKNFNPKMERLKYKSEAYYLKHYLGIKSGYIKIFEIMKEIELYLKIIFLLK